jgi:hypothetical protein
MLDDEKLTTMIACFLHCDKPELVEYLQDLIMILQDYGEDKESYDDEMSSSEGEEIEDFEVVQDENGFFSLK